MDTDKALTPKQERFCREWIVDMNATAAAKRAGYADRAAHVTACRLLRDAKVAARIAELQAATAERLEVSADDVIRMLLESYQDAKAANQHGPAVRAAELLGRRLGMFIDKHMMSPNEAAPDDVLVRKLSGGDERRARVLREIIGMDAFGGGAKH
jgi:hypothetical protein